MYYDDDYRSHPAQLWASPAMYSPLPDTDVPDEPAYGDVILAEQISRDLDRMPYYARPMGNDPTSRDLDVWEVMHKGDGVVRDNVTESVAREIATTWNELEAELDAI